MEFAPRPLTGWYPFIIEVDPALDRGAETFVDMYVQYLSTGQAEVLPCKVGQKPAVFHLRHLYGRAEARVREHVRKALASGARTLEQIPCETLYEVAQLSICGAEDLARKEGGAWEPRFMYDSYGVPSVAEEAMGELQRLCDGKVQINVVEHLGREVIRRMFFAPL